MAIDKKKLLEVVAKNLNVPGLLADVLDEVLQPVLEAFVADSSNVYDDMLVAALYPVLETQLKEKAEELFAKLLSGDEEEAEA